MFTSSKAFVILDEMTSPSSTDSQKISSESTAKIRAKKTRQFPLRYKLLLVLTLIPVITLATYLSLAVRIFQEDKIAYVFDSSSNFVGTLASQVRSQIQSVLSDAKPFIQDYVNNQYFSDLSKEQFRQSSALTLIAAFELENQNNIQFKEILSKDLNVEKPVMSELAALINTDKKIIYDLQTEQRAIAPLKNADYAFFETVVLENPQDRTQTIKKYFIIVASLRELTQSFLGTRSQKTFLIKSNGDVLVGPEAGLVHIEDLLPYHELKEKVDKLAQGVEEVLTTKGQAVLMSYSKTGYGDLSVVSFVEKNKALAAVGLLIRRSMYFFGVLISVTLIISILASSQLTSALTQLFAATQKVSEGDFDVQVSVKSNDEVGMLATNFNLMAQQIAQLMMDTAQKARMENELQTAKTVQETLFPEAEKKLGPLHIAGYYEPASECGGDWWHYCYVGDKIYMWIGDATGHGAPAALITSAAKSAATLIENLRVSPAQAMELMNKAIYDVSKGRIMMTFVLSSLDVKTGELTYVNASHEAPFLMRKEGGSPIKKKNLILLNENNNPRLGQSRDSKYSESKVQLLNQDSFIFYTDGIADIQDKEAKNWGERDFIKNLLESFNGTSDPVSFKNEFAQRMKSYRQDSALIDDVTFFIVKYSKS